MKSEKMCQAKILPPCGNSKLMCFRRPAKNEKLFAAVILSAKIIGNCTHISNYIALSRLGLKSSVTACQPIYCESIWNWHYL